MTSVASHRRSLLSTLLVSAGVVTATLATVFVCGRLAPQASHEHRRQEIGRAHV